jgi:YidC/Oxa1 family membrane protein insertase
MSDLNNNRSSSDGGRTLIAVLLSVVVITAGVVLNDVFFPTKPSAAAQTSAAQAAPTSSVQPAASPSPAASAIRTADGAFATPPAATAAPIAPVAQQPNTATLAAPVPAVQDYTVSTDLLEATFTNKGGNLTSLKLKKHKDLKGVVNLILPGQETTEAFTVAFGGVGAPPLDTVMDVRMIDATTIEFSKTFLADVPGKPAPVPFVYRKVFSFRNGEYLFGLAIDLENSVNEALPLDTNGTAYTLSFAPQIGPQYNPLSKNSDYRKIETYVGGKKKEEKVKNAAWSLKDQPAWVGIGGKYFVFLEIPEVPAFSTTLSSQMIPTVGQTTRVDLSRPTIRTSKQVDSYYFYFGPKTNADLGKYNYADHNAFQKADLHLDEAMDHSNILGWLEAILKFLLNIFYKIVPNYGAAIALVTLLVKACLFPLTKKGSIASAQMQEMQPKMQALQAKYKNNPEKLNKEMAEFYKQEGMNPMSGCLPLLIQFPIFIAMYNLFNTHFDLRGAMFIPGWIPDLSAPESVWNFAPFRIPLLGWSDLRLLPIIYLASQLFYGKFTQQPNAGGQSAMQMKIMMYGMPIIFFFILYDVPSGLLVYWIVSNLLTIVQQLVINDILKQRKKALAKK